jgi:hypothetical protein
MKGIFIQITSVLLLCIASLSNGQDHTQTVHQHLAREGWRLLKLSNPSFYNCIEANYWIGQSQTNGPWAFDQNRVVAGAWREDEEDVVWNYVCWGTATNSHFWYSPNPDDPNYNEPPLLLECTLGSCSPPGGAWSKLNAYIHGGWEIRRTYPGNPCGTGTYYDVTFQRWGGGEYRVWGCGQIGLMYDGLVPVITC